MNQTELLSQALDEVRDGQIEEAAQYQKKRRKPWLRWGGLAACLAVAAAAALLLRPAPAGGEPIPGGKPVPDSASLQAEDVPETAQPALQSPDPPQEPETAVSDEPASPIYSVGVQWEEVSAEDYGGVTSEACLAYYTPEEIFAMDTVIFRGIPRSVRYFRVRLDDMDLWYRVFAIEVTACYRGDLQPGDIYNLLCDGPSTVSGLIESLGTADEAIFMPRIATGETGFSLSGSDSFFCYADLAELYLGEGIRFLFLEEDGQVDYARDVYDIPAADGQTVTLDDVAAYIAAMTG